jgi:predicted ATPase/DNA-binding SARP family transcriptional activator
MTNVRILGPVQAWDGDRPLSLGGPRQLKLFAVLLLHANRAVSTDALVDAVWGETRSGAANRLQMAVNRLRTSLEPLAGDGGPILRTVSGGYLLSVAPGTLDADVFTAAVPEARRRTEAGDHAGALQTLRDALALWQGPALAEVAFEDFAQAEIRRLEELRVSALELCLEAELALGRHAEVIPELESLVAQEPARERLAGLLMLALYRAGRQTDALEAYQHTRVHLLDELGIEPGPELAQLQTAILTQDPALNERPAIAPAAEPAPAPAPPPARRRHNLPAVRTSFVGRERELEAIDASLRDCPVVTLVGVGGVGKTRLALEFGERSLPRWPDGVWLVELAAVGEASAVADAAASVLGLDVSPDRSAADEVANRLTERELLLVLDNCEHVLEACAALAGRVARRRSGSRVLATSRAPLAVTGERAVPVAPLALPDEHDPDELGSGEEAVVLFVERAGEARPGFAANGIELDSVRELCRALEGIPLAIELAASRVRAMTPTQILTHLGDRLSLVGFERDRDTRHRNLETTIAWSYDLLPENRRGAFRRLCVFPAPFTLAAAGRVLEEPGFADAVLDLVDNSLLAVAQGNGALRYRMLDTLREFGLRRLRDGAEGDRAHERHLAWAAGLLADAVQDAEIRSRTEVLPEVEADYRNLIAALTAPGPAQVRLRAATQLTALLFASANLQEIRRLLGQVVAEAGGHATGEARRARLWLGRSMCQLGELPLARAQLAAVATDAAAANDDVVGAAIAADRALVEIKSGHTAEAQAFLEQAAELAAESDPPGRSYRLLVEAQLHYDLLGELVRARELYETCIEQVRRLGPRAQLITALAALAELAVDLDDPAAVERCAREVLAITDPVADAYSRGGALLALGRAAVRAGRPHEATSWLAEGARSDISRGSMETPETLESLAHPLVDIGRPEDAAAVVGAAAAMRERFGLEPLERERAYIDAVLDAIRVRLPEADVKRHLEAGRKLTERELLALIDDVTRGAPQAPVHVDTDGTE